MASIVVNSGGFYTILVPGDPIPDGSQYVCVLGEMGLTEDAIDNHNHDMAESYKNHGYDILVDMGLI